MWLPEPTEDALRIDQGERLGIDSDSFDFTISTATTTFLIEGSGYIEEIRCIGGVLGNVTIYDNVAGSGRVILPAVTPVANGVLLKGVPFNRGLCIVTAAASVIVGTVKQ